MQTVSILFMIITLFSSCSKEAQNIKQGVKVDKQITEETPKE